MTSVLDALRCDADEALSREAIRVYRRYQEEIVESLNLCPWAERTRLEGRVQERVVLTRALELGAALHAVEGLAADPAIEIGLLLFPLATTTMTAFERFVSRLSAAEVERHPIGTAPFAMAAFHPDAQPDLADAERLIPFLRRTPDPTIQLVRCASLERVREGFQEGTAFVDINAIAARVVTSEDTLPLRTRLARANEKTVRRVGVAELERRFGDITRDRNAAYARLPLRAPRT